MHGTIGAPRTTSVDWRNPDNVVIATVVLQLGGIPAGVAAFGLKRNVLIGWAHRRGVRPAPASSVRTVSAEDVLRALTAAGATRAHLVAFDNLPAGAPISSHGIASLAKAWCAEYARRISSVRGNGPRPVAAPRLPKSERPKKPSAPKALPTEAPADPPPVAVEPPPPVVEEPPPTFDAPAEVFDGEPVIEASPPTGHVDSYSFEDLLRKFPNAVDVTLTEPVTVSAGFVQQCRTPLWGMDPSYLSPSSPRRVRYVLRTGKDAPEPKFVCGNPTPGPDSYTCDECRRTLREKREPSKFVRRKYADRRA